MAWRVARYLVGSLVVLGLAACGHSWLAEREPWRHEAEVACLQSGAVKESASIVRIEPITGPGICGADFPYKVSALGGSDALGYTDDLRPPGAVPGRGNPLAEPPPAAAPQPYTPMPSRAYPAGRDDAPVSISPPGLDRPSVDDEGAYQFGMPQAAPPPARRPMLGAPPATLMPPAERVPLGPERAMPATPAVAVQPTATLACPMISALQSWLGSDVQSAAMRWFGAPVVSIKQWSAYSCRTVNNQPGKGLSEHAFGNALDVASFTLADGRVINVEKGWHGLPEEQGFLRDVHLAACKRFMTVLAPGSDMFHYNHIHLDLRYRQNGYVVCRPAAIPGEKIAGRAPFPREVTGSIKKGKPTRMPAKPAWRSRDAATDGLPLAQPGED